MSLQITLFCSLLWLSNIPLYICTTSSLSIHLLMDSGCFHVLAIVSIVLWVLGHSNSMIFIFICSNCSSFGHSQLFQLIPESLWHALIIVFFISTCFLTCLTGLSCKFLVLVLEWDIFQRYLLLFTEARHQKPKLKYWCYRYELILRKNKLMILNFIDKRNLFFQIKSLTYVQRWYLMFSFSDIN